MLGITDEEDDEDEDDEDDEEDEKECPDCGDSLSGMKMIPDNTGNGLHEGYWCDFCGEEVYPE